MNPQEVIDIAFGEVGYLEKSKSAYICNPAVIWYKLDGAGYDNITKYAYEIDREDWYCGSKQYQPWCSTFVDWCFLVACEWNIKEAARLKNHSEYDAVVDYAIDQYKAMGRWFKTPEPGDQIFFSKANGIDPAHTGLVISVDDDYVYTVEGNSSTDQGVVSNGGGVVKKWYRRNYYRILGFGRPLYDEEDDEMTGEEIYKALNEYLSKLPPPDWAEKELEEAKEMGITDGKRPRMFCSRLEAAIMCKRAAEKK
jgi:CHAP domain.